MVPWSELTSQPREAQSSVWGTTTPHVTNTQNNFTWSPRERSVMLRSAPGGLSLFEIGPEDRIFFFSLMRKFLFPETVGPE